MSTPDGSQANPWIVTTYAELVNKAANSGEYVRINNDINIIDEYPNGDMPQLALKAIVDGNNKKISNWYKTSGEPIYVDNGSAQLYNCTIANIYAKNGACFVVCNGYNADYHFINCNFYGVLWMPIIQAINDYYSSRNFKSCSFNIENNGDGRAIVNNIYSYIGMKSCYIKVKNKGNASDMINTTISTFIEDSYIEANIPCGGYSLISNSVLDITTTATFTVNGNSSNALCILNSTHAPNATVSSTPGVTINNGFALVDDTHWLDVNYLNGIGFNIG